MSLVTYQPLALVSRGERNGLEVETCKSKLDMVLRLLGNGSISDGDTMYGCSDHLAALRMIAKRISEVRKEIKRFNADDSNSEA